jgi:Protein of unknown function (DUF4089)
LRQRDSLCKCDQRDIARDERRICNDMAVNQVKPDSLEAYVRAALALQGYAFDEARIAEIILQFSRIEVIARTVINWPLPFAAQVVPALRP